MASSTPAVPVLTCETALQRLRDYGRGKRDSLLAMYSTIYEGIVTDPVLMTIPLDDHMAHRGHAVFDTASVVNGFMYNSNIHIDRILKSASEAKIIHTFTKEWIRSILVAVARVANKSTLDLRYWISSGPGDFSYSPKDCIGPCFYCVAFEGFDAPYDPNGIYDVTISYSEVGMKASPVATLKSNNYLANVLLHLKAVERGGSYGIWIGADGFVKEGPINSILMVDSDGVLKTPPFIDILPSCTCRRVMAIAAENGYVVKQENILPNDIYNAREVFYVGGDTHIVPVTKVDGRKIGEGCPGPIWKLARETILEEAASGGNVDRFKIQ
eukprot:TRINITY_DN3690_c0_g1_i18.p1 TRINITY_DN3690_c0_g1~~TRINITY_DN3690_c0_g1_i18.p1  ORF type:complete len:327 (+),score=50.44 TRINITY_DN3690_c0_g1_i18:165-1145(+)